MLVLAAYSRIVPRRSTLASTGSAVHNTILVVDIERFGSHRADHHRVAARRGLYRALRASFRKSGIPWVSCHREDRGDGVLVLAPPDVAKELFTEALPHWLAAALREHNSVHSAQAEIRLRVALHAGEVRHDRQGVAGACVNLAFRLLEADQLKSALSASPGVLALIASSWFFDEVVRNSPASDPLAYRRVEVAVKETTAEGWVLVPDQARDWRPDPAPPADRPPAVRPADRPDPAPPADRPPAVQGPRQLPASTSLFAGRTAELSLLTTLMKSSSATVVSAVSGMAGIGKTALALRWAQRAASAYPDGQLYLNLRGFDRHAPMEPGQALDEILRALDIHPEALPVSTEAKSALYRSLLAQRRMLVVLDNAKDAEQVRPLLPGPSPCAVIITSRSSLDSLTVREGVQRLSLSMLTADDALDLLTGHLGEARVDAERGAAVELTELCGYLPLALVIVAARAAHQPRLPLGRLVSELRTERTRLDALDGGDADLDLRAVLSWSYQQLAGPAARAFRLLGLACGQDITLAAAGALFGTEPPAAGRLVETLLRAHLLQETSPGRFGPHDLLRVYAAERAWLEDPETDRQDALNRLSGYYLSAADAADRVISPHRYRIPLDTGQVPPDFDGYSEALAWLTAEQQNLVAMCETAGSCSWRLAYTLRGFFFLSKRWDSWIRSHQAALATAQNDGDRYAQAVTLNNLGLALLERGHTGPAEAHYRQALDLFREVNDPHGEHNALANIAAVLYYRGGYPDALRENQRALAFYEESGNTRNTGITLRSIALVEVELGRFAQAIDHATRALTIFTELGLHLDAAMALNCLGEAHYRLGDSVQASGFHRQAITMSRLCGSSYEEARAHHRLGQIALDRGRRRQARYHLMAALGSYAGLHAPAAAEVRSHLERLGA